MRRTVVKPYLSRNGELTAYLLDPGVEQAIESSVEHGELNSHAGLPPAVCRDILDRVTRKAGGADGSIVAITSAGARYFLRQLAEPVMPNLVVLSHGEIPAGVKVLSLGVIQ